MATRRKKSRRRKAQTSSFVQVLQRVGRWLMQREVWGIVLTAVGAVTNIALFSGDQGVWTGAWSTILEQLFGFGAYIVGPGILASGVLILFWESLEDKLTPSWQTLLGVELIFFVLLGLVHVIAAKDVYVAFSYASHGMWGGFFGWAFYRLLVPIIGRAFAILILSIAFIASLLLATRTNWRTAIWGIRTAFASLGVRLRQRLELDLALRQEALLQEQAILAQQVEIPILLAEPVATRQAVLANPDADSTVAPRRAQRRSRKLPPLDLLISDTENEGSDADSRMQAQIIEKTLREFGVPARVTEWKRGPTITQFGVVPGYVESKSGSKRVRVSKITALADDLALALAASPIRVEAPIPGRAMVGIEVPNPKKAIVGLRGVLESKAYKMSRGRLRIALGRNVSGEPIVADLTRMPHLLLAGATGTGKSACLNAILASLLFHYTPDQLQLLLVDPKRVELSRYNGIPHLLAPVVVDVEKTIVALKWTLKEMEHRYELFSNASARNIDTYNEMQRADDQPILPRIVIVIDELADVMVMSPEECERALARLGQMARATGIHLVLATQRPSVDVVTGLIKANFPSRISFAVSSQVDSRVVLDVPGAEKLLGRGDMLYMASDQSDLLRIQGCWISEQEIDDVTAFWRQSAYEDQVEEVAPWEGMELDRDEGDDDVLQAATELVREHGQASASFLQRQLHVGYPRAARLIDQLEEHGIVGPPETGGRSRQVLTTDDSETAVESSEELGPDQ